MVGDCFESKGHPGIQAEVHAVEGVGCASAFAKVIALDVSAGAVNSLEAWEFTEVICAVSVMMETAVSWAHTV